MCKLYQIEYTCLHVAKIEMASCRSSRSVSNIEPSLVTCSRGIIILTQNAPHKCPPCRNYDRDRWRRGWPALPLPLATSLEAHRSRLRPRRVRPPNVDFEDDDGDDNDLDEAELERTILGMGLDFEKFGKTLSETAKKVEREGAGEGNQERDERESARRGRIDDEEEPWTEHFEGNDGVALGMEFGKDTGIVLSGGLNGEDTGSSEGFGLTIDGAIAELPATSRPTLSTTSTQLYVSPYSFSEDRPTMSPYPFSADRIGNTPPRIARSPIRRKRADTFATESGGSEDNISSGEPGSRFGGFGGRRLRGRRQSTMDAIRFPELGSEGGGVPMERGGSRTTIQGTGADVAMQRAGRGVPMERTVSHRASRSDTTTQGSRPRIASGGSYRGTEMLGGGAGLGLGIGQFIKEDVRLDSGMMAGSDSTAGDLGLASGSDTGFGTAATEGAVIGGVFMGREDSAGTIRSDDTTRSYSLTSRSLPTRRRRSTVVARPRLGPELNAITSGAIDLDGMNWDAMEFSDATKGTGEDTTKASDDTTKTGDEKESVTAQFLDF